LSILFVAFSIASLNSDLYANYTEEVLSTQVEIDGQFYGAFDKIQGLQDLTTASSESKTKDEQNYTIITLDRDFVTDPSLYQWAKNNTSKRDGLKDIHLVMKNSQGEEVSRYVLKLCRPLSWSLESADPTLGGYHENIKFAVQEIAVY
jgi:hypothetical protein